MMNTIYIYFDGGCRPTNPGNKYGSYEILLSKKQRTQVQHRDRIKKGSEIELGHGTSNEAEFDILLKALDWTVRHLWCAGFNASDFHLQLFTDSRIVASRLDGSTRGKNPRMIALGVQCLKILKGFKAWRIDWHGRNANVDRFGH